MDVKTFAEAIARAEGFYVEGSIPQRARNPGDIRLGNLGHGTIGEGITVFPTVEEGWVALMGQARRMLTGRSAYYQLTMTIAEVGMMYSGGDPNWAVNVAVELDVPETTTLAELAKMDAPAAPAAPTTT